MLNRGDQEIIPECFGPLAGSRISQQQMTAQSLEL